jgi:hypothetical protein
MKVQWDRGGKLIFAASFAAGLSFLLPWFDDGMVTANGIQKIGIIFAALFCYPLFKLLRNEAMNQKSALACAVASVLLSILVISDTVIPTDAGRTNVSGTGAHLYLVASIALIVGVMMHHPVDLNEKDEWSGSSE